MRFPPRPAYTYVTVWMCILPAESLCEEVPSGAVKSCKSGYSSWGRAVGALSSVADAAIDYPWTSDGDKQVTHREEERDGCGCASSKRRNRCISTEHSGTVAQYFNIKHTTSLQFYMFATAPQLLRTCARQTRNGALRRRHQAGSLLVDRRVLSAAFYGL